MAIKEKSANRRKNYKQLIGRALRDAKDKTVLVEIARLKLHPKYQKRYTSFKKFLVHTDIDVKKDQQVLINECRPASKRKAWKVEAFKEDKLLRGKK